MKMPLTPLDKGEELCFPPFCKGGPGGILWTWVNTVAFMTFRTVAASLESQFKSSIEEGLIVLFAHPRPPYLAAVSRSQFALQLVTDFSIFLESSTASIYHEK